MHTKPFRLKKEFERGLKSGFLGVIIPVTETSHKHPCFDTRYKSSGITPSDHILLSSKTSNISRPHTTLHPPCIHLSWPNNCKYFIIALYILAYFFRIFRTLNNHLAVNNLWQTFFPHSTTVEIWLLQGRILDVLPVSLSNRVFPQFKRSVSTLLLAKLLKVIDKSHRLSNLLLAALICLFHSLYVYLWF